MSIDDVQRNIGIISRNNNVLAGMQASADEARELRTLLADTGVLARETSQQLMSLQRGKHASGMPAQQRGMLNKLNNDFEEVLRRFQQLARSSAKSQRKPPARRGVSGAAGSHDPLQARPPQAITRGSSARAPSERRLVLAQGDAEPGQDESERKGLLAARAVSRSPSGSRTRLGA